MATPLVFTVRQEPWPEGSRSSTWMPSCKAGDTFSSCPTDQTYCCQDNLDQEGPPLEYIRPLRRSLQVPAIPSPPLVRDQDDIPQEVESATAIINAMSGPTHVPIALWERKVRQLK